VATRLLERLLRAAEEGATTGSVIEILVLQALARQARGDIPAALASLERALTLAEPEGYVRIFVDEGPPMASLLRAVAKRWSASSYVRRLLAAVGTTVNVETLEGPVELEFAPGTQPGEIRVLRGRGMPVLQGFGRGDHRVIVNVAVPRHLTDEQRRLLDDFERLSTDETYKQDEGFFEKLKSAFR